jgi:hypothetical protein
MVEELRRARREGVLDLGDDGQRLIVDFDRFGGVACLAQGLGDHKGDRLADIADFPDRQQRPRRIVARRAVAVVQRRLTGEVAEPLRLDLGASGDEQNAGHPQRRRCIYPPKVRMRDR